MQRIGTVHSCVRRVFSSLAKGEKPTATKKAKQPLVGFGEGSVERVFEKDENGTELDQTRMRPGPLADPLGPGR